MAKNYINKKLPFMWHGGDYCPEQWLDRPDILAEDIKLMKKSGCNMMSIGIFAWSALEPEEGVYRFDWLDRIFDSFEANDLYIDLATPSAARPPWMVQKHPEVMRTEANGVRRQFGVRANFCWTSPYYREKVRQINEALAKRYGKRKALGLWHISNEYSGECHCALCQASFREFLKRRYSSLDELNKAWWTPFWSHVYTDWEQIEAPTPSGENHLLGLRLDWQRFVSFQTCDFLAKECEPLRKYSPEVPITTNLMGFFYDFDQREMAPSLDVASWDSYPSWGADEGNFNVAQWQVLTHDMTRALKPGKPFLLMESTPSMTNWQETPKLKRPGMHKIASLLATASGSDSVMYFQWRKSRGSWEKFHGAVVGHDGRGDTRTFLDVEAVGEALKKLKDVAGTTVDAKVAIVADWQNWWALNNTQSLHKKHKDYWPEFVSPHHKAFFKLGVNTDVIDEDMPLDNYKVVVAPVLYMVRKGVAERLEKFVGNGGTLLLTFGSGMVDEHDLCFLDCAPGPLRKLAGVWAEELDSLYDTDANSLEMLPGNKLGIKGSFEIKTYCENLRLEGAEPLALYGSDFYKGTPALTVNKFGKGKVYYLAANVEGKFLEKLYAVLATDAEVPFATTAKLPEGVSARSRGDYLFVMNFGEDAKTVDFKKEVFMDLETGEKVTGKTKLPALKMLCLKK